MMIHLRRPRPLGSMPQDAANGAATISSSPGWSRPPCGSLPHDAVTESKEAQLRPGCSLGRKSWLEMHHLESGGGPTRFRWNEVSKIGVRNHVDGKRN